MTDLRGLPTVPSDSVPSTWILYPFDVKHEGMEAQPGDGCTWERREGSLWMGASNLARSWHKALSLISSFSRHAWYPPTPLVWAQAVPASSVCGFLHTG